MDLQHQQHLFAVRIQHKKLDLVLRTYVAVRREDLTGVRSLINAGSLKIRSIIHDKNMGKKNEDEGESERVCAM